MEGKTSHTPGTQTSKILKQILKKYIKQSDKNWHENKGNASVVMKVALDEKEENEGWKRSKIRKKKKISWVTKTADTTKRKSGKPCLELKQEEDEERPKEQK